MSTPAPMPAAPAPAPIDIAAVRALRFEIGLFLDEIAGRAADVLESVGIARAKLAELERAYEGGATTTTGTKVTTTNGTE